MPSRPCPPTFLTPLRAQARTRAHPKEPNDYKGLWKKQTPRPGPFLPPGEETTFLARVLLGLPWECLL